RRDSIAGIELLIDGRRRFTDGQVTAVDGQLAEYHWKVPNIYQEKANRHQTPLGPRTCRANSLHHVT
ncbi:MAG: hypothetical protein ACK53L_03400, partial [Pirellulaceae bacterium]